MLPSSNKANATSGEGEVWKLVNSGTKSKAPAQPECLQLQNSFIALEFEEVDGHCVC